MRLHVEFEVPDDWAETPAIEAASRLGGQPSFFIHHAEWGADYKDNPAAIVTSEQALTNAREFGIKDH